MTPQEHLDRLDQRRRYLEARIAAKKSVGWETIYDQSERDALAFVLDLIVMGSAEPEPEQQCPHPEDKRVPSHNMGEEPQFWCQVCKTFVKGIA